MNIKYNQHAPSVSHQMRKRGWRVNNLRHDNWWYEYDFSSKREALRLHRRAVHRGQPAYIVHGGKVTHRMNIKYNLGAAA